MQTESSLPCSEEPTFMQVKASPHLLTLFKIYVNIVNTNALDNMFGFLILNHIQDKYITKLHTLNECVSEYILNAKFIPSFYTQS